MFLLREICFRFSSVGGWKFLNLLKNPAMHDAASFMFNRGCWSVQDDWKRTFFIPHPAFSMFTQTNLCAVVLFDCRIFSYMNYVSPTWFAANSKKIQSIFFYQWSIFYRVTHIYMWTVYINRLTLFIWILFRDIKGAEDICIYIYLSHKIQMRYTEAWFCNATRCKI